MHRNIRCQTLFSLCAALTTSASGLVPVSADDGHNLQLTAPKTEVVAHQKTTDSLDRLSVKMKLGDGLRVWRPTRRQLGITYAPGGSDSSTSGTFTFKVDTVPLLHYLREIAPYVQRSPVDAKVIVDPAWDGNSNSQQVPAVIVPERDGASLDISAAATRIKSTIESDPSVLHVVLPLRIKYPEVRSKDLKGINSRIAYFVTRFNPHDKGRTQTVRLAINIIDGHVIEPGAVLSINDVVGERTGQRGFGMGHVFVDGKMAVQLGGGMCQVATTLFNAAMLADLKIIERYQHVRTVPYVQPGRDATVYYGQKDFKFENDTDTPVYVSYKTTRNHAIVGLFGRGVPGRTVSLINKSKRLGERYYKGLFYRVVHHPDGTVEKDRPFYSTYKWTPALDFNH